MGLPDSYTYKPSSIGKYFDGVLDAQPPERFSLKFLERLGFTSTSDRLFISILKQLGFLNADGVPQQRYFDFLDRSRARYVLADAVREAFGDLFAINTKANELTGAEVKNKLRTLYAGKKTDDVIDRIAKTFSALCEYADFSKPPTEVQVSVGDKTKKKEERHENKTERGESAIGGAVSLDSLQYHINIVLPESRDQAVYDSIFRSLREHLGTRHG